MLLNPILKEKLLIDVSCGLYVLFLAPVVKNIVEQSIYGWGNAKGAGILAIVLLLFNVLEIFAVLPFISQILNEITDKKILFSKQTSLILLIVMHAVVTLIAVIFAFQLLGYTFKTQALFLSIVVVFILAKEVFLLKNCISQTPIILFNAGFCKWVIALYSCLIFTIFLDGNQSNSSSNIYMLLLNMVAMGIFFASFYYAMRLPYTYYSVVHRTSSYEKLIGFVSFLIAFLPFAFRKLL